MNLLFVSQCCADNNCIFVFDADSFSVHDKVTGKTLYKGKSRDGLYPIYASCSSKQSSSSGLFSDTPLICASVFVSHLPSTVLWHLRHGHPSYGILNKILSAYSLPCDEKLLARECVSCLQGKMAKLPFPLSSSMTHAALELVHSDVWGPSPVMSVSGYRYYVNFVDDLSKYTWIFR